MRVLGFIGTEIGTQKRAMLLTGLGSRLLVGIRVLGCASFVLSPGAAGVLSDISLLYSARFGRTGSMTYWWCN